MVLVVAAAVMAVAALKLFWLLPPSLFLRLVVLDNVAAIAAVAGKTKTERSPEAEDFESKFRHGRSTARPLAVVQSTKGSYLCAF